MSSKRMLPVGLVLTALASAAGAQVMDWGPIIQAEAMGSAIAEAGREGSGAIGSRNRPSGPPASLIGNLAQSFANQTGPGAVAPAKAVSGRYTPSPAVRQKLAGIMDDAAAKQGAAKGREMRELVLSGKALAEYERIAPAIGLRANDAVDAFAFYMLAQWSVANDYRDNVTPAQVAGVRRQAANAYATVAGQLPSDALRQEFAEMLAIQGAIMSGVHEAAVRGGDDAAAARYAAVARKGGEKVFTVDPTTIELTDSGFRKRG